MRSCRLRCLTSESERFIGCTTWGHWAWATASVVRRSQGWWDIGSKTGASGLNANWRRAFNCKSDTPLGLRAATWTRTLSPSAAWASPCGGISWPAISTRQVRSWQICPMRSIWASWDGIQGWGKKQAMCDKRRPIAEAKMVVTRTGTCWGTSPCTIRSPPTCLSYGAFGGMGSITKICVSRWGIHWSRQSCCISCSHICCSVSNWIRRDSSLERRVWAQRYHVIHSTSAWPSSSTTCACCKKDMPTGSSHWSGRWADWLERWRGIGNCSCGGAPWTKSLLCCRIFAGKDEGWQTKSCVWKRDASSCSSWLSLSDIWVPLSPSGSWRRTVKVRASPCRTIRSSSMPISCWRHQIWHWLCGMWGGQ